MRKILFLLDPEWAHFLGAFYLRARGFVTQGKCKPVRLVRKRSFELAGHQLDSPLGVAAGFDKNATLVLGLKSLGFGFVEVGTVTPRGQKGNPRPRLFRVPEAQALINRMGFNNDGADRMAERLKNLRALHSISFPIGVNVGKNRDTPLENAAEDYVLAIEKLYAFADYLVVNLSSPNTPGLTSLQEADTLKPLLRAVREARDRLVRKVGSHVRPLFLKLSPDLLPEARKQACELAVEEGFGLIASNTSRRRDFPSLQGIEGLEEGGLSGAPLREDALRHIQEIRSWVGPKPILISVGGLSGGDDAQARLDLGASLLQAYTSFIYEGPAYPRKVTKELAQRLNG